VVRRAKALFIDFFESFIDPLEAGLGMKSSHTIGRSHSAMDKKEYQQRIEAINFAMAHDDGASHRELAQADVILVGVSRSGKTADQPISRDAVRREGGELPADPRGLRPHAATRGAARQKPSSTA
jgi:regulator of PEP synthase PpsR (kinase-PPPase family)